MNSKYLFLPVLCLLISCSTLNAGKTYLQNNPTAAQYNVQLGLAYLAKDPVRAKEKLLLALQEAPKWSVALDAMAYYCETTDDIPKAAYFYQKALRIDPNSGMAQNNYGAFLCKLGHYEKGLDYLLKAAVNSNYIYTAKAYENAGVCALPISKENAKVYFLKAIKEDPSIKDLQR